MKNNIITVALLALVGGLLLAGCSTFTEHKAVTKLAVQYATIKVIEKNPDKAPRIVEIAQFVRTNAGSETAATVALLETAVRAQIDWTKLDPADTILVDTLIVTVRDELIARLGDGPLAGDQLLVVAEVAGWIQDAALLTAPPASRTADLGSRIPELGSRNPYSLSRLPIPQEDRRLLPGIIGGSPARVV